jgi:hypothetical protein
MRFLFSAALTCASLAAAPVLAWSDNMTQPASNENAVWAYPSSANYCPAGLQPVTIGGVICCGTPTHYGYKSHPAATKRYYRAASDYVAYGKGYSEGVAVYRKGD